MKFVSSLELSRSNTNFAEIVLDMKLLLSSIVSLLFQTDTDQIQIQPCLRNSCIYDLDRP